MSNQYDQYLEQHKANVIKGYEWLKENLPELTQSSPCNVDVLERLIYFDHDKSKSEPDEYEAYDAYFYGNNKSFEVVQNFKKAWLLHIHRNPHHWQHWVLINDDPNEGEIALQMPYKYVIEMICDWWSFSWQKGDLTEIFKWYNEHKDYIKMNAKTSELVKSILNMMEKKLNAQKREEQNDK